MPPRKNRNFRRVVPSRIKLSADKFSALCRYARHNFEPDNLEVFVETSLHFGAVWVGYNECVRGCGTVRMDVDRPGGEVRLTTRYDHRDPQYDTTMSQAEARRIIVQAAIASTPQLDPVRDR